MKKLRLKRGGVYEDTKNAQTDTAMHQTGNGFVGAIWGKVVFLALYPVFIRENCCHSPGCMTMQPGENHQAVLGCFSHAKKLFLTVTEPDRAERPLQGCGQELLC